MSWALQRPWISSTKPAQPQRQDLCFGVACSAYYTLRVNNKGAGHIALLSRLACAFFFLQQGSNSDCINLHIYTCSYDHFFNVDTILEFI